MGLLVQNIRTQNPSPVPLIFFFLHYFFILMTSFFLHGRKETTRSPS